MILDSKADLFEKSTATDGALPYHSPGSGIRATRRRVRQWSKEGGLRPVLFPSYYLLLRSTLGLY